MDVGGQKSQEGKESLGLLVAEEMWDEKQVWELLWRSLSSVQHFMTNHSRDGASGEASDRLPKVQDRKMEIRHSSVWILSGKAEFYVWHWVWGSEKVFNFRKFLEGS